MVQIHIHNNQAGNTQATAAATAVSALIWKQTQRKAKWAENNGEYEMQALHLHTPMWFQYTRALDLNSRYHLFLFGHIIQRILLQQMEFQLLKVHSSNPANKAAKQKMKENKLSARAAFPASHWQYLRQATLSLSATGHVSNPGDWGSRLCLILAAVHQAGRCAFAGDLATLLSPGSPDRRRKLELHEGVRWNMPVWTRDTQGWKCLPCKL